MIRAGKTYSINIYTNELHCNHNEYTDLKILWYVFIILYKANASLTNKETEWVFSCFLINTIQHTCHPAR